MSRQSMPSLYNQYGETIKREAPPAINPQFLYSQRTLTGNKTDEVYSTHAWVYACVRAISKPSAGVPKYITTVDKDGNDEDARMFSHPILSLLSKPNPMMSGNNLWEAIYLSLLLPTHSTPGGQVFLYMDSGGPRPCDVRMGDVPMFIWPYSDNVVKPEVDTSGKFKGWWLTIAGTKIKKFADGELIRIREYNPYNPLQGLSPYSAAMSAIDQDMASDRINTEYMVNSGAIGGVLSTASDMITASELKDFVKAFEDAYMGEGNSGRVAALAYGMKFDSFMKSNKDMQYIEMRKENRHRIQAVYGVNAEELGIYESGLNRATAEQASRDVWQKTRLPLMDSVTTTINSCWIEHIDQGILRLRHDLSVIDALRDVYESEVNVAAKMVREMNIPASEACRITGIPIDNEKYPHLDKALVSVYMVDANTAASGMVPYFPATVAPVDTAPIGSPDAKAVTDQLERAVVTLDRTSRNDALWGAYVREVLDPGEAEMRRLFVAHWRAQLRQLTENLNKIVGGTSAKSVREFFMPDISAVLWNGEESLDELISGYDKQTAKQMKRAAKDLKKTTNDAIVWQAPPENIQVFVDKRRRILQDIESKTARDVYDVYNNLSSTALADSWTPQEFARAVASAMDSLVDNYSASRALTTARTETGSITQAYRMDAFDAVGVEQHEWITARDSRVRPSHEIEGQTRDIDKPFNLGDGETIMYPMDPNGSAENVISCRCLTIPIFKGGEA